MPPDPLRSYRLRVFDGTYEVLRDRPITLSLDLESPNTPSILDRFLVTLTRAGRDLENEPMDSPRLEVWDVLAGERVWEVL